MSENGNGGSVSMASVGLNGGTLVLIALIVIFCSGWREPEYSREIKAAVQKQADVQQAELKAIRQLLEERLPPADAVAAQRLEPANRR